MVIRSSSAREVDRLVADLREGDATRREAAVARLRILGNRAVPKLIAVLNSDAPADARVAALKALEDADDPRVAAAAASALSAADHPVVATAIAVLRGWLARDADGQVLDALARVAFDTRSNAEARAAAREALSDLPAELSSLVQAMPGAAPRYPQSARSTTGITTRNDKPRFADPDEAAAWIKVHGDGALSDLHHAVLALRASEQEERLEARRVEWTRARGALHAVLARRGSRVALYDLRESFAAASAPLPLDFLTAVTAIGDADCLEPLARAWAAAPAAESWWRGRVRDAAAAIAKREKLSGRHAAIKRVRANFLGFL